MAETVREKFFANHGTTLQFHPAVTYEDFIVDEINRGDLGKVLGEASTYSNPARWDQMAAR